MQWINFLHFYQPANIEDYSIKKALDKSYWRLLRLLEEHPRLKMTANVSGCLLERLEEAGEKAFIDRLRFLVKKGKIELTGSAYYHGFLPLLPEREVIRQIKENEKILKRLFGLARPVGFFLPEMAYSPAVAKLVKRLGYKWIVLDEISFDSSLKKKPDIKKLYVDDASGLQVVFRQRAISNSYPPDRLLALIKSGKLEAECGPALLTATDAELYGLRHEDPTGELEKLARADLKSVTVSAWLRRLSRQKPQRIAVYPSSWESSPADILKNRPYKLWHDKDNKIQELLWKLAALAWSLDERYKKDKNYYWYRWHLSRGLASCTFWWASAHDFSKVFGPYAWSPDDIERGLGDLVRSIRSLNDPRTKKQKLEAESYALKIKKLVWENHWRRHWLKNK